MEEAKLEVEHLDNVIKDEDLTSDNENFYQRQFTIRSPTSQKSMTKLLQRNGNTPNTYQEGTRGQDA